MTCSCFAASLPHESLMASLCRPFSGALTTVNRTTGDFLPWHADAADRIQASTKRSLVWRIGDVVVGNADADADAGEDEDDICLKTAPTEGRILTADITLLLLLLLLLMMSFSLLLLLFSGCKVVNQLVKRET
jgi:hypothetical protein